MGILNKVSKNSEFSELTNKLQLNTGDLEFILLAIKNSMISGAQLDQAVATITKIQGMYTALQKAVKKK
tara:strand:- start:2570 stop:2776 length:207 start_codon:yes stop_codon:yes gene_type:complete